LASEFITQQDVDLLRDDASARERILDRIEMKVMREFMAVAHEDLIERENLKLYQTEDGVGAIMFFSRWARLGLDRPATQETLANVLAWMRANGGSSCFIDLSEHAAPKELRAWLNELDVVDSGARMVTFWRTHELRVEHVECEFDIREVGAEAAEHLETIHRGAASGWRTLTPILRGLVGRDGWRTYVAYLENMPVACAAMFTDGGISWRGIAATLPKFQGKGAHAALVSRMTRDALESGAKILMAQTFRQDVNQPAKSEKNLLRTGYTLSHIRQQFSERKLK
jgi:GNAT superfamily N-acetyltransferase